MDAEAMAARGLTPLLDPRFLPALENVLSKRVNALALNRNEIRLFVNKEVGGDDTFITKQAWDRIWNDTAGAEIKVSEYYQKLRDIIETYKAEAKVGLVTDILDAQNYLEMNRAQFLINQITPGISKEPVEGVSVGNVTIVVNQPANLKPPPQNTIELAASADDFQPYEEVKQLVAAEQ